MCRRASLPHPRRPLTDVVSVTDITYIPIREGSLYLAVLVDQCSRAIVGRPTSGPITRHLSLDALGTALARRQPPPGLMRHSDRGSQHASGDYHMQLTRHGVVGSIRRRDDCWDNAVVESFFETLKVELVHETRWPTRTAARTARFDSIAVFYNRQPRHF
jgi:transposase InsO family protein